MAKCFGTSTKIFKYLKLTLWIQFLFSNLFFLSFLTLFLLETYNLSQLCQKEKKSFTFADRIGAEQTHALQAALVGV